MRILITGASGFLGYRLAQSLIDDPRDAVRGKAAREVTCVDHKAPETPLLSTANVAVHQIRGGLDEAAAAIETGEVDAVVHLAAVVSSEAEADFELGYRVNLDGTRRLLEACRHLNNAPVFLFSSSIAVFGRNLPPVVTDTTWPQPCSSYGAQKLAGEILVTDYTRKGFVRGLSLRLPTIIVRPGAPNRAASSFASSIIREPLNGVAAVCPVGRDQALWVLSPGRAVNALRHALRLAGDDNRDDTVLNLPGITADVADMVEAVRAAGGDAAAARISFVPDPAIALIVGTWPARFAPEAAMKLGFRGDSDIASIVAAFKQEKNAGHPAPIT